MGQTERGYFIRVPETIKDPEELASESFIATGTASVCGGGSGTPWKTFPPLFQKASSLTARSLELGILLPVLLFNTYFREKAASSRVFEAFLNFFGVHTQARFADSDFVR